MWLPYLPTVAYLAFITAIVVGKRRVPYWVHGGALAVGAPVGVVLSGVRVTALSVAGAGIVMVLGVLVASKLLSQVGLLALVVSLALLPFPLWCGVGIGLALAAAMGTIRTVQVSGLTRVNVLAGETFAAMGVSMAQLTSPDLSRLPTAVDAAQFVTSERDARRMRMYLPPYLLGGVLLEAAWTSLRAAL